MPRANPGEGDAPDRELRLLKNPDGWWTARDSGAGVTAQGERRDVALDNLDAVVEAVTGEGGQAPTDDEIRALGIEPELARTQGDELPEVLE